MKSAGAIIDGTPWHIPTYPPPPYNDTTRGYIGSAPNYKLLCVGGSWLGTLDPLDGIIPYLLSLKTRLIGQQFIPVALSYSFLAYNNVYTQDIVNLAYNNGMLFVNGAGNDEHYPYVAQVDPYGISVACLADGNGRGNSTYGPGVKISAPSTMQATSYAAPVVAGIIGLMKSYNPSLSPDDIRTKLLQSVNPIGYGLWHPNPQQSLLGTGRVDAFQAISNRKISPLWSAGIPQNLSGPIFMGPSTYPNIDPQIGGVDTISFPYGETINLGSPSTPTVIELPRSCTLKVWGTLNISNTVRVYGGAIKFMNGAKVIINDRGVFSLCNTSLIFGNGTTEWAFSNGRIELEGVKNNWYSTPDIGIPFGSVLKLSGTGTLSCASDQEIYIAGECSVEANASITFDPVTQGRLYIEHGGYCYLRQNSLLSDVFVYIFDEGLLNLYSAKIEISRDHVIVNFGTITATYNSYFSGKNHEVWGFIQCTSSSAHLGLTNVTIEAANQGIQLFNASSYSNSLYDVHFKNNLEYRTGTAITLQQGSYLSIYYTTFDTSWASKLLVSGSTANIAYSQFKYSLFDGANITLNSTVYSLQSSYSENQQSGVLVNSSNFIGGVQGFPAQPAYNRLDNNAMYGMKAINSALIQMGDYNFGGSPLNATNAFTGNNPKSIYAYFSFVEGDLNWYDFIPLGCNGGSYAPLSPAEKSSVYDFVGILPQVDYALCADNVPVPFTSPDRTLSKTNSISILTPQELFKRATYYLSANMFRRAFLSYDSLLRYHINSAEANQAISHLYYGVKQWMLQRPDSASILKDKFLRYYDSVRVLNLPSYLKRQFTNIAAALHRDVGSLSTAEQLYDWLKQQTDSTMKRNALNNLINLAALRGDSMQVKSYGNSLSQIGMTYTETKHYLHALYVSKLSGQYTPAPPSILVNEKNVPNENVYRTFLIESISPNPFWDESTIYYTTNTEHLDIQVKLLDKLGREIRKLDAGAKQKGLHTVSINSINLPGGMYFVVITDGRHSSARKLVVVK